MRFFLGLYRSLAILRLAIALVVTIGGGILFIAHGIYSEIATEQYYRERYGAGWKAHYEDRHGVGSVRQAYTKLAVGFVGLPAIGTIVYFSGREAGGRNGGCGDYSSRHRRSRRRQPWYAESDEQ